MNDLKELRAIADDLTFAAQKLDGVDGLEALPKVVSDTHKLNLNLKKIKPMSIIFNSIFGLLLGAAIGAFAAYHFAKPLDISSTARGVSVLYDQDGLATFYFEKNAWHGFEQDHHYVNQQMPYNGATLARKLGEKTLKALDDTK